ncbi:MULTISPECIES: glucose PTS transporter subunit IIA [unclassified Paenibacillus]|uniref:glucose PTS transporter subunit IIA n=1 Tax=unclassified Paenibacillus TaxID=185978 RepID=UPI001AE748C7|nr:MULTISPECIES: glucose PTS transporter subunit IIA [unclassified Paenibacillus]MBP1156139.1 PTS system D-glucosamine-specific IIC component [Paenibacillus sp. PvP091]MBP1168475.1 PTS system D-glucosamine-specific IIC component [Paenibacillus sp. PvR098]MBP2439503.1 PTS system D-glucosamine-specific IIC component [Paenibacillus sp. PvP052]
MNWMGNLQQLGRSLMLPTITLPVAAILLRLGSLPWEQMHMPQIGEILTLAGTTIFTYLPLIFAVGVALGLTESAGIAGMSALIGHYMFSESLKHFLGESFQLGVPGGILIGLLAAVIYHRVKHIQLPEYIQFFGGPRMVPLLMGLAIFILIVIMIQIGPFLEAGMQALTNVILGLGGFGTFLYGIIHRLLVPSGLHHVFNNFFWFQLGAYDANGQPVFGDLPRFFAGDPEAGFYMAGLYPVMMFALPAIALAIIQEAREDLKPKIRATFLTAAFACFLTGVTEPIEFAFLFVAPYLFIVHAILSGFAMWIAFALDIHHGFSYSAGAIDFLINLHLAKNGLLLIPIGLGYGIVYYVLFRWAIRRFRIPTPGREEGSQLEEWAGDIPYRSPLILQALGGKNNIKNIEACITRLRLTLVNDRQMDTAALKHLGAAGVIRLGGGNVQVVFGTYSELIREEINKALRKDIEQVLFNSPMQGRMIPLEEVPDKIFAGKLVGDGVAFLPEKGELVSPVAGKIIHVYPSLHAIGIETQQGLQVLLHIGIDTAHLEGKYFTCYIKEGDQVEPGQLLVRFNLNKVKKNCKSLATPMLITNVDKVKSWSFAPYKTVKKGQASVMSVVLKNAVTEGGNAFG